MSSSIPIHPFLSATYRDRQGREIPTVILSLREFEQITVSAPPPEADVADGDSLRVQVALPDGSVSTFETQIRSHGPEGQLILDWPLHGVRNNRRYSARTEVRIPVDLVYSTPQRPGAPVVVRSTTEDLSESGMLLFVDRNDLGVGTELSIRLRLPNALAEHLLGGVVRYARRRADGRLALGVEFRDPDFETSRALRKAVWEVQRKRLPLRSS